PGAVVALVRGLAARASRRLAVRTGLDVAAEGQDQALGGGGDLRHGGVERGAVPGRRRTKAADLANVLTGGGLDLAGGRRVVLMTEGSDASAHAGSVPRSPLPGAKSARRCGRAPMARREAVVMCLLFLVRKDGRSCRAA